MRSKFAVRVGTAVAVATVSAVATGAGSAAASRLRVHVRVEGPSRTVVAPRTVRLGSGSVVRHGHGAGVCPRTSAQGALNAATHGHWSGTWYASYDEWIVTHIRGVHPHSSSQWWELFVNGQAAAVGACQQTLSAGDHVMFALVKGNGESALMLRAPQHVVRGRRFRVHVYHYDAHGSRRPVSGAVVRFRGHRAITNADGRAVVRARGRGRQWLRVSDTGYVRTETRVRVRV